MKILTTIITLCFSSFLLFGQIEPDSRIVYCNTTAYLEVDMIESWDSGTLTSKETQKFLEWQKRLKFRFLDRVLEKSTAYLSEKGMQVQELETAGKFGMMALTEGYPTMVFPKKALKKKGAKLDVGDYFIRYQISFTKGGARPSLKGYPPDFELDVEIFNVSGEKIKSYKTNAAADKKMGVVSSKKKEYFSRIDFDSIEWIMENFGAALDQAIEEALTQLID